MALRGDTVARDGSFFVVPVNLWSEPALANVSKLLNGPSDPLADRVSTATANCTHGSAKNDTGTGKQSECAQRHGAGAGSRPDFTPKPAASDECEFSLGQFADGFA